MLGRSIMPREAARFLGDEAKAYDQDDRGESGCSPERHTEVYT